MQAIETFFVAYRNICGLRTWGTTTKLLRLPNGKIAAWRTAEQARSWLTANGKKSFGILGWHVDKRAGELTKAYEVLEARP